MADTTDPAAALLEARIAELDTEIAGLEAQLRARVEEREARAAALAALGGMWTDLTARSRTDNIDNMMPRFERIKHGKGRTTNPGTEKLRRACNAKNLSIIDLAKLARKETPYRKLSQPHLSMAANGQRPIDWELAEWIEKTIGFPATKSNWPKLRDRS